MKSRLLSYCFFGALLLAGLATVCRAQTTVALTVPATGNIWLAGMPDGSRAGFSAAYLTGDSAPAQSPIQVTGLPVFAGLRYHFRATGGVAIHPDYGLTEPDGEPNIAYKDAEAENGISNIVCPYNALIGVFVGGDAPSASPTPATLDFSSSAIRNFTVLSPGLKQVFFIGNGLTESGQSQQIIAPVGATRLYLGTMDIYQWENNIGTFDVQVTASGTVGGIIALQGTQNAVQPIDFTFRPSTGADFTRTTSLNFAGGYTINDIPPGEYTVSIKGAKWLRKNIAVDTRMGNVTYANAQLKAGDANNDNFADIGDLLLLIAAYNKVSTNAGYSEAADFNCDGVDDIADLLLLVGNYNQLGDS